MTDPTERNEADVAGLVERLRATWPKIKAGPVTTFQRNLIHEAAATLTTCAARIAELEAEVAALERGMVEAPTLDGLGGYQKVFNAIAAATSTNIRRTAINVSVDAFIKNLRGEDGSDSEFHEDFEQRDARAFITELSEPKS
jgi:hypothetical protein